MGIEAPQEPWHTHTCRPQRDRRDGWQPSTDGTRDDRSDAAIGTCTRPRSASATDSTASGTSLEITHSVPLFPPLPNPHLSRL